jgi:hypothetical protein
MHHSTNSLTCIRTHTCARVQARIMFSASYLAHAHVFTGTVCMYEALLPRTRNHISMCINLVTVGRHCDWGSEHCLNIVGERRVTEMRAGPPRSCCALILRYPWPWPRQRKRDDDGFMLTLCDRFYYFTRSPAADDSTPRVNNTLATKPYGAAQTYQLSCIVTKMHADALPSNKQTKNSRTLLGLRHTRKSSTSAQTTCAQTHTYAPNITHHRQTKVLRVHRP